MSTCSPVETLKTLRRFNGWFDGFTTDSSAGGAPLSVNVTGYLRDESGWGAAARGYIRALRCLGVPTRLATVATPSVHLEMAAELLVRAADGFDRVVIAAEPLFQALADGAGETLVGQYLAELGVERGARRGLRGSRRGQREGDEGEGEGAAASGHDRSVIARRHGDRQRANSPRDQPDRGPK